MTEVCAYSPRRGPLPLRAINHISHLCKDVAKTAEWYSSLLGFSMIKRPASFDFDGAWLYGYGVGLHLIAGHPPHASRDVINPKADHLSFACECGLEEVEALLKYRNIEYKKAHVEEGGILVTQLFMHDPDGNMVELCNCDLLPVQPLSLSRQPSQAQSPCPTCFSPPSTDPCHSAQPNPGSYASSDTDMSSVPHAALEASSCTPCTVSCSQMDFAATPFMPQDTIISAEGGVGAVMSCKALSASTPHTIGMRRVCSVSSVLALPYSSSSTQPTARLATMLKAGSLGWVSPSASSHSRLSAGTQEHCRCQTTLHVAGRRQPQRSQTVHGGLKYSGSGSSNSSSQGTLDVMDASVFTASGW